MLNKFYSIFAGDIAIDLGTANTIIWVKGEGVELNEPSIVAKKVHDEDIIAIGNEAKEMLGRTHPGIEIVRPLKDGTIADYRMTDAMIQGFMRKIKSIPLRFTQSFHKYFSKLYYFLPEKLFMFLVTILTRLQHLPLQVET